MGKIRLSRGQKAWLGLLLVSLFLNGGLFLYERLTATLFYFYGVHSGLVHMLLGLLTTAAAIAVALVFFQKRRWRALAVIAAACLCIPMDVILLCSGLLHAYYPFSSPDGKRQIVVRETKVLLHTYGAIYKQVNPLFMECVEPGLLMEGAPFSAGNYAVDWQEDQAVVTYTTVTGNGQIGGRHRAAVSFTE